MADSIRQEPPSTGSANGTFYPCDKGWNDPPKHVFSPTNAGRKRIDPRKRVAHDLTSNTSTGFQLTQQQQPTMSYLNGGPIQQGYPDRFMPPPINGISNSTPYGVLPHASSNPDISSIPNNANTITQLPADTHSTSMPFNLHAHEQNTIHNPPFAVSNYIPDRPAPTQPTHLTQPVNYTPPQQPPQTQPPQQPPLTLPNNTISSNVTPLQPSTGFPEQQPVFVPPQPQANVIAPQPQQKVIPSLPPMTMPAGMPLVTRDGSQDGRKLSAPKNNLNNSIFDQLSTPTMLQSTHLANKLSSLEVSTAPTQNVSGNAVSNSPHLSPKVGHANQPQISPTNSNVGPPMYPQGKESSTNTVIGAPPTNGFYVANKITNGSSPKSTSPYSSIQNTPDLIQDKSIIPNDTEFLNDVTERLLEVHNKCSCVMTNKIADEINKKILAFKTAWTSGKLSTNVKLQMSNLSQALDKCEFNQADSIHKSLIVSNSGEVMSWMIGIKKLISSYQKVVEENNKY